jgi:hypothetical protein
MVKNRLLRVRDVWKRVTFWQRFKGDQFSEQVVEGIKQGDQTIFPTFNKSFIPSSSGWRFATWSISNAM